MSIYYCLGDEILWNPSNRPAGLFNGQIGSAAIVFGVPSGLGDVTEDEVQVDLPVYQEFVATVFAEYSDSLHGLFQRMIIGFLGPALVLVERAGGTLPSFGTAADHWTHLMHQQSRVMPR